MKEIYIEYDNIELTLIGNYTKGDANNYSYPGSDSCFDCHQVLCGGQDIIDMLIPDVIMDLEIYAVEKIEEL